MVEFGTAYSELPGVEFLSHNPLSALWNATYSSNKDVRSEVGRRYLPLCYVAGMGGFVLALPWRISYFVSDMLTVCFRKDGFLIAGGSFGHLISAVIGIACPPLAYRIDEWIQGNQIIYKAHKVKTFNFSVWIRNKPDFKSIFSKANQLLIKNEKNSQALSNKSKDVTHDLCMFAIFAMIQQDGLLTIFLSDELSFDLQKEEVYSSCQQKQIPLKDAITALEDGVGKMTNERLLILIDQEKPVEKEIVGFYRLLEKLSYKVSDRVLKKNYV